MKYKTDIIGKKFGRLTVIQFAGVDNSQKALWECVCDCGKHTVVSRRNLTSGSTKSCGCWRRERPHGNENVKHGGSRNGEKTRLYKIWGGMKQRCYNPNAPRYDRYGGRGIQICSEWQNNFSAFRAWATENGYADHLTIDRIDNDRGYYPDNCRWATRKEQSTNRSPYKQPNHKAPLYDINGEGKTASEWAKIAGISTSAFCKRYHKGLRGEELLKPDRYHKHKEKEEKQ